MAQFKIMVFGEPVDVQTTGFRGGHFTGFYVRRGDHDGPGWFIFGRNPAYGGSYIALVARPDLKARRHPHYNCKVRRGWRLMREAQAVCDVMTARDRDSLAMVASLGELHGTVFKESV